MRASPVQLNFNSGEISPLFYGRTDSDRYKAGLAICQNYVPTLQGPLLRRPGTKYVHEVREPAIANCTLIPFKYSSDDSYIIEFGRAEVNSTRKEYCRFFKDNAIVTVETKTITGATQTNPVVVTAASHGYATADRVVIGGVSGMTELNNREFHVVSLTTDTFSLRDPHYSATVNGTAFVAYSSGGSVSKIYEIYGASHTGTLNFDGFRYAQSGDVIYSVIPDLERSSIFKLSRFSDASWTLDASLTMDDGPYLSVNEETTTLNILGGTTGTISLVASAVTGINNGSGFQADDVGRLVRAKKSALWGWAKILTVGSTVSVTVAVGSDAFDATGTTASWRLGAFRSNQNPSAICFHEGRMWLGGGVNSQFIGGSVSDDYENFEPTDISEHVAPDSGVGYILAHAEANEILWLASDAKGLVAGTKGSASVLRPNNTDVPLDATNTNARKATNFGSANIAPVQADKATLYVQSSGKKLREFMYFYDIDSYRAADLTILSEHITGMGLIALAFQKEPHPLLWGSRTDGTLVAMVYERDFDNLRAGWTKHVVGGSSDASGTQAQVEEIAVIPSADGTREELWMTVKRYINGRTRRYIEYMTQFFDGNVSPTDAFFVDSGLSYDGNAAVTVSGLNHLEGEVLSVLNDGAAAPNVTVSGGRVTLDTTTTKAHFGYGFVSRGQVLRFDSGSADGTSIGKTRRTNRVGLMLYRTGGLQIGMNFTDMDDLVFRTAAHSISQPVPLFTGIKSETLEADYDLDNQFCFQQSLTLPGTIVAIYPSMVTQDR